MQPPRDYQINGKNEIYREWHSGKRNVIGVFPTGAGKTRIKGMIFSENRMPSIAIAHRQELVGQISCALAEHGVPHKIIAPKDVRQFCVQQHIRKFRKSFVHDSADAAVSGIDTLIRRHETFDQWCKQVRIWDIDECFPAGTLISTPNGHVPIESICVGDIVTAFDEHTGEFSSRNVTRLFRNPTPDIMIDIQINGRHVRCTSGHPFWTRRGWVEAGKLQAGDDLFVHMFTMRNVVPVSERTSELQVQQNRSCFLHETLRYDVSRCETAPTSEKITTGETMRGLRSVTCATRKDVQSCMSGNHIFRNDGTDESSIRITKNEIEQSYGTRRTATEDGCDNQSYRSSPIDTWREWQNQSCRNGIDKDVTTVGIHSATSDQDRSEERFRDTLCVQGRYGEPGIESRSRSGRSFTYRKTENRRSKTGRDFEWVGLESVSFSKRTDHDGPFVYNIEVADLHTYVANDVVVHNCHHVLRDNKWGKGVALFPNAFGLGLTATPGRCDRKGLGRNKAGVFDSMVIGPSMRELIDRGYLSDYICYGPPQSIDTTDIPMGADGDFSQPKLRDAAHKSTITGDIVEHYLKIAPGKRGLTFVVDVEIATETAAAFNAQGVPAMAVSAKTPDHIRAAAIEKLGRGELLQLVNVDLFGEGMDVPAVEVVSAGRPTQSFAVYAQQFGRMMRIFDGKTHGIYIDHVNNIIRHRGPPDQPRLWSLDDVEAKQARTNDSGLPVTSCVKCFRTYFAVTKTCPYCKHVHEPVRRDGPQFVDGDLTEYSAEFMASLARQQKAIDGEVAISKHADPMTAFMIKRNHLARQEAQQNLRDTIAMWAGIGKYVHMRSDAEMYRRFYHQFGIDVANAKLLGRPDAEKLTLMIRETMT